MTEKHDFQPPPMTPEQFYRHLKALILRMKADSEFRSLAFFTRHGVSNLDEDFARMIAPIIGRDLRLP